MPKGKDVKQGGPWPVRRRYAVAVNAERIKGEIKAKRRRARRVRGKRKR